MLLSYFRYKDFVMPGFESHVKGGLYGALITGGCFLLIQLFFHSFAWVEFPIFILLVVFGSMWPDTDIASKSRIVIYTIFVAIDLFLIFALNYYYEAAILGLFTMMPAITKHRGWTHSIKGNLFVGLPLLAPSFYGNGFLIDLEMYTYRNLIFFGVPYYLSFFMGAMTHLYLDRASWFQRFKKKKVKKKSPKKKTKAASGKKKR